ncbi:MAG: hypothetical protein NV1_25 [Nanoarchaeotal virus 1]|nr:MAG: hypothetical protein NV1_25 [Nanoarchaeotal virus 1]
MVEWVITNSVFIIGLNTADLNNLDQTIDNIVKEFQEKIIKKYVKQ